MSTGIQETYLLGVLLRPEARDAGAPLVFDIPRSGAEYFREFQSPAPFDDVKSSISMYLETLFDEAPEHRRGLDIRLFPERLYRRQSARDRHRSQPY